MALLVNVIAPYRLPVYESISSAFNLTILHGGTERNRSWQMSLPASMKVQKVMTWQLEKKRKLGVKGIQDGSYVHLNLGLLFWIPKLKPDIIISNEMGMRSWIAILFGLAMNRPVWIWSGATMHSERNIGPLKRVTRKLLAKLAPRWISYGTEATEYLRHLGVSREKVLQIQNCVPEGSFKFEPIENEWFKDKAGPVLLTVGQLTTRKGLNNLIESAARVQKEGYEFSLVIVGDGPQKAELEQLALRHSLKNFEIIPNKSQATLRMIYYAADVFVFPTLEDIWGLVVNEAILCRLPVVCSANAGCATELIDPENVFDPLDPLSIDNAVRRAVLGQVTPSDPRRLRTCDEVGAAIVASLEAGRPVPLKPI
ncbi:glycosyltransferase family 4 protein [Terriglobus albidus]|uniref:glycosyltransferase family 4 protein n=1 Tax=Terriglobus albidus TaxID=1592106 RepID=UPI0021DFFB3E|nr:glycosyltransferase family 4 protein [Terriglobus albidus]